MYKADLVFETFDTDQNGHINFQEFVKSLSILSRGNIDERLDWLYRLYDSECTGAISWERLYFIISSVDDMIGSFVSVFVILPVFPDYKHTRIYSGKCR